MEDKNLGKLDDLALSFIQNNNVRIETDSASYRALVRALFTAYQAGASSGTHTVDSQSVPQDKMRLRRRWRQRHH